MPLVLQPCAVITAINFSSGRRSEFGLKLYGMARLGSQSQKCCMNWKGLRLNRDDRLVLFGFLDTTVSL